MRIATPSRLALMKTYRVQSGIGKARHVVSFHDGQKRHDDGSSFFDIRICKNKRELAGFIRDLNSQGYSKG